MIQSDDDLAIVVGHEVAHIVAGHSAERVSQQMLAAAGGGSLVGRSTKDMDESDRQLLLAAYGAGASLGVILPYSRLHEEEADEIGLLYAAKAGYDPRAAYGFWGAHESLSGGGPPGVPLHTPIGKHADFVGSTRSCPEWLRFIRTAKLICAPPPKPWRIKRTRQ